MLMPQIVGRDCLKEFFFTSLQSGAGKLSPERTPKLKKTPEPTMDSKTNPYDI